MIKPIYLLPTFLCVYACVFSNSYFLFFILFLLLVNCFFKIGFKKFMVLAFLLGILFTYLTFIKLRTEEKLRDEYPAIHQITLISDSIMINGDQLSFQGKSSGQTYQVFYKLKSEEEKLVFRNLRQSLHLTFDGELSLASPKRNFNGFDYQSYLKQKSIYRILTIKHIKQMEKLKMINPYVINDSRRRAIVWIQKTFPSPMQHYMTGLLFGYLDKSFDEMTDIYSSLGIIHLFALSGLQVGFFLGLFKNLLQRLGLTKEKVIYFQIPFSFVYSILTGSSLSVIRSLLQAILSELGVKKWDAFSLTLLIMIVLFPYSLMTVGGGLTIVYAFFLTYLGECENTIIGQLKYNVLISLFCLPFLTYYFSSFQPISVILTLIFSFLFDSLILPLLSLAFLLSPILVADFLNLLFQCLENVIQSIHGIFPRDFVFGHPSLLILLVISSLYFLSYDFRKLKIIRNSLIILVGFIMFFVKHPVSNEVTVVDIGQGDSIFIRDSRGKTVLIDVGGKVEFSPKEEWQIKSKSSNAEHTLIPYLKSRGVGKIDTLVLTHTDTDHMGDMLEVAKVFQIKHVMVSPGSLTQEDFVEKLKELKTDVEVAKPGDEISIMGSSLQVLYPLTIGDGSNNDSIVLYGKLIGLRFLFTGDLEIEGENALLEHYPNLKVDVLKAGHHGSKGSSSQAFLNQLHPSLVLISAGQNNRYRHPHQEMLDRVSIVGSHVYRTDQEGAIRFIGFHQFKVETVR